MAQRYKFSIESKRLPPSLSGEPKGVVPLWTDCSAATASAKTAYAMMSYPKTMRSFIH